MKIPNYDVKREDNSNSLNDFLNEDFRMLIAGQTRCGKTNTLMHMIRKPLIFYDKIYFYSSNCHHDKIQDLERLMSLFPAPRVVA